MIVKKLSIFAILLVAISAAGHSEAGTRDSVARLLILYGKEYGKDIPKQLGIGIVVEYLKERWTPQKADVSPSAFANASVSISIDPSLKQNRDQKGSEPQATNNDSQNPSLRPRLEPNLIPNPPPIQIAPPGHPPLSDELQLPGHTATQTSQPTSSNIETKEIRDLFQQMIADQKFLASQAVAKDVISYIQRWDRCTNDNDFEVLISACSEIIARREDSASELSAAYNNRGAAFYMKGRSELAFQDLTEAIRADPTNELPFFNRCKLHLDLSRLDEAIGDCGQAINLDRSFLEAYLLRGASYYAKGRADITILENEQAAIINRPTACRLILMLDDVLQARLQMRYPIPDACF